MMPGQGSSKALKKDVGCRAGFLLGLDVEQSTQLVKQDEHCP